jgi:hypothetical protein
VIGVVHSLYIHRSDGDFDFLCAFDDAWDSEWKDHIAQMRDWAEDRGEKTKYIKVEEAGELLDALEQHDLDDE